MASGFSIAGTSDSFTSKSSDVFGGLDRLEVKHSQQARSAGRDDLLKRDPGREACETLEKAVFKRPPPPVARGTKRTHGGQSAGGSHGRSPHQGAPRRPPGKWTRYDLSDVEVGEATNRQAALSFLAEMRQRREQEQERVTDLEAGRNKVTFTPRRPREGAAEGGPGQARVREGGPGPGVCLTEEDREAEDAEVTEGDTEVTTSAMETGEKEVTFKKKGKGQRKLRQRTESDDETDD